MPTDDVLNEWAAYVALATIVPAFVSTAVYGLGAPWYRSALGTVTFVKWLAIVLVFAVILARRFFGEYLGYGWVALVTYSLLLLAFSAMAVVVILEVTYSSRIPRKESTMTHVAPINKNTVPEIWFAGKRVIRTLLVNLVVIVPTVNLLLPALAAAFGETDGVPVEVTLWVNAAVAGVLVVTSVLTKIIAIPAVNAFLVKIGAGSVPKKAVEDGLVVPTGGAPLVGR